MNRHLVVAVAVMVGAPVLAHAAPRGHATYRFTDPARIGAPWIAPPPSAVSHVIFMNRCSGGCTIHAGNNNSLTDTSSVVSSTSQLSEYSGTDTQWQQIVSCVKSTYSPFAVTIVDQRPTSGDYHEAIVAGHASEAGEQSGVLGVSPFSCGYIPNSISFSFADEEPTDILDICWTVSQETAHSWGLDHEYDDRDPMTYLPTTPEMQKIFQNSAGSCGEYSARTCNCTYAGTGNAKENSYALILATFGGGTPDTTPPTVSIASPANHAQVVPGFQVTANVADDVAVAKAVLTLDGTTVGTATGAPFQWSTSSTLSQGAHHLEVTAYDLAGNTATADLDVTYGQSCTTAGCSDPTQVCVDGTCMAGPGTQGGLGSPCTSPADCESGQCGDDGAGDLYCVTPCTTGTAGTCPGGFSCLAGTGQSAGVCWPNAESGGPGGCDTSGTGSSFGVLLLGVAVVMLRRRRGCTK